MNLCSYDNFFDRNERKIQQTTLLIKSAKTFANIEPYDENEIPEIEQNIKKLQEILSKRVFQLANAYMNESVMNPEIDK